jgi:Chitobiase/beta-hexosaminidase C-terminal domain/Legume lectin domain
MPAVTRRWFTKSALAAGIAPMFGRPSFGRHARGGASPSSSGGATPVFNFANFASEPTSVNLANNSAFVGNNIQMLPATPGHEGSAAIFKTQQPPGPFTTIFTFQPMNLGSGSTIEDNGFVFVIQNAQSPPSQPGGVGINFGGDANTCGYSAEITQFPPVNALAIKFDAGNQSLGQNYPLGGLPSSTGLYLNQGPAATPGSIGLCPCNDLNPYGINFYSGDTYQATIVYDGSLITMVLADTTSGAQARFVWPLNLVNTTNATSNFVGFSAGRSAAGFFNIGSWSYFSGFDTRLATPTFSPSPGNYTTSQTVTISGPAGATVFYTTNGLLPTSSSTEYTGPITVSANQVIQAVAIQSGFTDSLVESGNYVIGASSNTINFPTGFVAGNLLPVGYASLNGSAYQLTDTNGNTAGAVWFPIPVNVSTFSTEFTLNLENGAQGMCFVIQNNPQPYVPLSGVQITGTSGQISFDPVTVPLVPGQYITIAGAFGGTGSISGYSGLQTYLVGATNGTTTATLCIASVAASTTPGSTIITTVPQSLIAGDLVYPSTNGIGGMSSPPNNFFYVLSSGLTSTTCELATAPGGAALSATSAASANLFFPTGYGGGGATLTTTPGTPSGLTYSVNNFGWSGGPTAVGAIAQGLGYGGLNTVGSAPLGVAFGLLNSVAVTFAQFGAGGDPTNSVGLYTNGANPFGSGIATGLTFNSTFNVTLEYDGTNLDITMQATSGGTTFTHSFPINIPATVGADMAYVGFAGGSGGSAHAVQAVTAWKM